MSLHKILKSFSLFVLIPLAIGLLCSSCFSIKYSGKGGSMPPGAKTFSVQFVENQARLVEPGLSQHFTDELKDYLQNNARELILVRGNGDIDFEAVITGYEPSTPSTVVAGDEASQNKFTITVKLKYTCNVNPDLDFESSFSRYKLYNVDTGFEDVKDDLTEEILDLILEDMYKRAFVNW